MWNSNRQRAFIALALISAAPGPFCLCVTSAARGASLRAGDILVADPDFVHFVVTGSLDSMRPTIWKIDPRDGSREVVTSRERGAGVPLLAATSVVVDSIGRMTIADPYQAALLYVDPRSGDRSYLSVADGISGFAHQTVSAMALDRDDSLVVLDYLSNAIFRVDPETGYRTLISGPARGEGPALTFGSTIALDRSGGIWTARWEDGLGSGLLKVDPKTGDRELISGQGIGDGLEFFGDIHDVHIVDDRTAFVVNLGRLFQVDLTNGNRSLIVTDGPRIETMFAIAPSPDGSLLVVDEYAGTVYRTDLNSRRHTLLSGNTPEWGPRIWMPQDIFVVVPEPVSASHSAIGIVIALACSCRCRRLRYKAS